MNKKKQQIFDLRLLLANRSSANVWGKGFLFSSENEQIEKEFNTINEKNNLLNMFSYAEKELSMNGRVVLCFQKQRGGDVVVVPAIPFFFNGVAKVVWKPTLAEVYIKYNVDTSTYVVRSIYTTKKVSNYLYTQDDDGQPVRMMGAEDKLAELGLVPEWNHNLGFLPLFEITNLPYIQHFWNNFDYFTLADWYPAKMFEPLILEIYKNMVKELNYNHARISIEDADQKTIERFNNAVIGNSTDIITNTELTGDLIIQTDQGSKVNFQSGASDHTKYVQAMESVLDLYFKFGNASRISEGGGAQKTAMETSQSRGNLIEFLNQKIINRENIYGDMINKLLIANGIIPNNPYEKPFHFEIPGNISEDNTSKVDNLIKQVQVGSMSIPEMISKMDNTSITKAKEKFQEVKDFNEENDIITMLSIGGGANVEDMGGDEEGGRPTKDNPDEDRGENG